MYIPNVMVVYVDIHQRVMKIEKKRRQHICFLWDLLRQTLLFILLHRAGKTAEDGKLLPGQYL